MTLALVVLDLAVIALTAWRLAGVHRAVASDAPLPHWPDSLELDLPAVPRVDPLEVTALLARERARARARAPRFVPLGVQRLPA